MKPVLSRHSKRAPKLVFNTNYHLMQVKSIAECSKGSILQSVRPSLRYHLALRSLFCLFLSGRLRQVLLYFPFAVNYEHATRHFCSVLVSVKMLGMQILLYQSICTYNLKDRFVLGQGQHAKPVAQVLQQSSVREISITFVAPQQHL